MKRMAAVAVVAFVVLRKLFCDIPFGYNELFHGWNDYYIFFSFLACIIKIENKNGLR